MNLKVLGAVLVIAACGGCGFMIAFRYVTRIQMMENIAASLEFMISDLQYHATPLPQLCRQAGKRCNGKVGKIMIALAEELDAQISPNAAFCMASVLDRSGSIEPIIYTTMMELGNQLGLFDLPGQIRGLEQCRAHCASKLKEMNRDKTSRLRSYQTLGLCAGAAIAILFV